MRNNEGVNVKLLKKKKEGGLLHFNGASGESFCGLFLSLSSWWVECPATCNTFLLSYVVFLPSFSRAQGMQLLLSWADGASLEKAASPIALAYTTLPSENQG